MKSWSFCSLLLAILILPQLSQAKVTSTGFSSFTEYALGSHAAFECHCECEEPAPVPAPTCPQVFKLQPLKPFSSSTPASTLKEMLDMVNHLRQYPQKWAQFIQKEYIDQAYNTKTFANTGEPIPQREGLYAVINLYEYLRTAPAQHPFVLDYGLVATACIHSKYVANVMQLTHNGANGNNEAQRVLEFGTCKQANCAPAELRGESILAGLKWDAVQQLIFLLIGDGDNSKGSRKFFMGDSTKIGFGLNAPIPTKQYPRWIWTIMFHSPTYVSNKNLISQELKDSCGLTQYEKDIADL